VVHEINNPLAGILNYARLMTRILGQGPLTPERTEKFKNYLGLVESESCRVSEIVSGLLTFSRKTEPVISDIRVGELVDRCILLCRHRLKLGGIQLVTLVDKDLPVFKGDFNQVQQCLINLIFNAVDAMPQGGTLTIRGYTDTAKGSVAVSVEDTGSGITPETMKHLFEPFFTTKKEGYGVGLGLSIVFGIMEQHEGLVEVSSKPGRGALFTLKFPCPGIQGGTE
jgi:signal transduction histidine kinase